MRRQAEPLASPGKKLKHTERAHGVWRLNVYVFRFDPGNVQANERRDVAGFERGH